MNRIVKNKKIAYNSLITVSAIIGILSLCTSCYTRNDKGKLVHSKGYVNAIVWVSKKLFEDKINKRNTPEIIFDETIQLEGADVKILSIDIIDKKIYKIIGYSRIPADNCVGNNIIRLSETLSRSTTTEFSIGGSVGIDAELSNLLSGALSLQLGYTKGTTIERSFVFEVEVKPSTNTEYNIVWKEVWQKGEMSIQNSEGKIQKIPFEIKSEIGYERGLTKVLKCN